MQKEKAAQKALQALRLAKGLTVEQASEVSGYDKTKIEQAENGTDKAVWEWMQDYVSKLGYDIEVLSGE